MSLQRAGRWTKSCGSRSLRNTLPGFARQGITKRNSGAAKPPPNPDPITQLPPRTNDHGSPTHCVSSVYTLCRLVYMLCRLVYMLCRLVYMLCRLVYMVCQLSLHVL